MTTDTTYVCTHCARVERRTKVPAGVGTDDESARVSGWRIGTNRSGERQRICPQCAGTDVDYWGRQTVTVALMAGIDAGNAAWGGAA